MAGELIELPGALAPLDEALRHHVALEREQSVSVALLDPLDCGDRIGEVELSDRRRHMDNGAARGAQVVGGLDLLGHVAALDLAGELAGAVILDRGDDVDRPRPRVEDDPHCGASIGSPSILACLLRDGTDHKSTLERPLSPEQLAHFDEHGYVAVEGVLPEDDVAELRSFFAEELFAGKPSYEGDVSVPLAPEGRGGGVRHDVFARYPELRRVIVNPDVLAALRSLLGDDFVFIPEMAAHDSRYGHWHKDTTPMERDGLDFHKQPDFKMVQCAIYFQDNDEYGGGLDVVPKSHREPDHTPPPPKVTLADRIRAKLGLGKPGPPPPEQPGAVTVPSRAGDLVIFNVLTNHQATQPRVCGTNEVPEEHRKFAIFFLCAVNNEHPRRYIEYIRGQYAHLRKGHSYPDDLLELAASHNVNLI